jgi:hypothetical protein
MKNPRLKLSIIKTFKKKWNYNYKMNKKKKKKIIIINNY